MKNREIKLFRHQKLQAGRLVLAATLCTAGMMGKCWAQEAAAPAPLDVYIVRPEPTFRWERTGKRHGTDLRTFLGLAQTTGLKLPSGFEKLLQDERLLSGAMTIHDLRRNSQEWQGRVWTHHARFSTPTNPYFPIPP